jgi:hypothetical protein
MEIFQKDSLYKLSSIFITASILRLLQSMKHSLRAIFLYLWSDSAICVRRFMFNFLEFHKSSCANYKPHAFDMRSRISTKLYFSVWQVLMEFECLIKWYIVVRVLSLLYSLLRFYVVMCLWFVPNISFLLIFKYFYSENKFCKDNLYKINQLLP